MDSGGFQPPKQLSLTGNVAENWRRWVQKFRLFLKATGGENKDSSVDVSKLLCLIGDEALEVYNTFSYEAAGDNEKLVTVLAKFEEYCSPRKNIVYERFKFFSLSQKSGQSFEQFLLELKCASQSCEFGEQTESLIRDRIVLGIQNKNTQERLLRDTSLTLQKAANFCRAAEESNHYAREVQQTVSVEAVKQKKSPQVWNKQGSELSESYDCKSCGYKHKRLQCPAYGKMCNYCRGKNHFSKMCGARKAKKKVFNIQETDQQDDPNNPKEEEGEQTQNDEDNEEFMVYTFNSHSNDQCELKNKSPVNIKSWKEIITVNNYPVEFKLDSGAEASVLPLNLVNRIRQNISLTATQSVLVAFGSNDFRIKPKGKIVFDCQSQKGQTKKIEFIVIEENTQPILGLSACVQLDLIKRIDKIEVTHSKDAVIQANADLFEGLGKIPFKHEIEIQKNAIPVIHSAKRIPLSLHDKLKDTLGDLESRGIVEKVNKPTEWVNSLVIVEKTNGTLRLCLDPRDLNKVVKREHHMIPTAENIIAKLAGKKVFSVVDMKDGFWQIPLTKKSANLCTFNTPFGRYRFVRLPFGICSAPEVFQKSNEQLFGDIDNVQIYFDDLIIAGTTTEEHDTALSRVFERARKVGIKFNKEKFQFRVPEVKYVGRRISGQGVCADESHIRPILEMQTPGNKKELMRFLGMVKHLGQFIPNLSNVSAPLRTLTRTHTPWQWSHEHDKSITQIKALLTSAPTLSIFDSSKPLLLQTDASKDGLGACIMQDGHPIAYASRTLTPCEKRYAQIEKELLSIVFGVERFHHFTYGRKVLVNTDHKPLESIHVKDLDKISVRLSRMVLRLLKYQLTVKYIPGREMYTADALSRAYLKDPVEDDPEFKYVVHSIVKYLPMTNERKHQFAEATKTDPVLNTLTRLTMDGWPEKKYAVPENVRFYWNVRENIHMAEGLVFLENRVLVPAELRQQMLKLIHEGHFGMEKSKARARQVLSWPGMSQDIESMVARCTICEKFRPAQQKEPMIPHGIPPRPWSKLAADILEIGTNAYLVVVDYYSKWLELTQLKNKTAPEVILKLKSIFARLGIPDEFVSDNMPFASAQFMSFAKDWDFKLTTSSPRYAQSNGMSEKAVSTAKQMLKKTLLSGTDIYVALMAHRCTPIKGLNMSPAQIMFNRSIKTKLPTCSELLEPKINDDIRPQLQKNQQTQKRYYDRNAKELKPLHEGDSILIRKNGTWEPAQVITPHQTPRSYVIREANGSILRRNRRVLQKSLNPPPLVTTNHNGDPEPEDNYKSDDSADTIHKGASEDSASVSSPPKAIITTKSGRVVKMPARYKEDI
jgi:RNase H-like domain found in reverse transcriptase/Reverse transcriptase (RNA-dependent DNA polymerase)/Integrase zinc binding domain